MATSYFLTPLPRSFDRTYCIGTTVTGNVVLKGVKGGFDHKAGSVVVLHSLGC
jgi:hypothetical protein